MDDISGAHSAACVTRQSRPTSLTSFTSDNNSFSSKPEKCAFHVDEVEFLGLIVRKGFTHMDPIKTAAIRDWPIPTTKKQLQKFRGI